MAHFAQLDEYGYVARVIVVADEDILDENGKESEEVGIAFCENLIPGRWVQTSYNGNFRGKYAAIGDYYDNDRDVFQGHNQIRDSLMAHFADLDENGYVLRVVVVANEDITDENGNESEALGIEFCRTHLGGDRWVQTSYNPNFRGKYAAIGDYYDSERDEFR